MNKNKKLKKGVFCTDIHFGKKNNSPVHNEDCIRYLEWFCKKAKEHNADYVGFLGDWNENRSALNIATLNYSYQGAKMLNDLGIPIYFVVGNHDLYYRNSRDLHSVIPFNEFDNFIIIDHPTVIKEIEGNVLFSPYLFHDEYPDLLEYKDIPFWAGHFEFRGFVITGYNIIMPTGPNPNDYRGPKHIVSGHFHQRQAKDNIVYIGNTFPMDFGDAGDIERGCMIYDHVKDEMNFENWDDCPRYIKTSLSELLEDDAEGKILYPQSRVQCLVDIPISFEESTYLRERFVENYKLREFNMEESSEIRTALSETPSEIDWDEEELVSINELVLRMLSEIESDHIDNDLLIDIYKNLKNEQENIIE